MSRSTYFVQECPTCGRSLQVRVEYLGKQLVCQHCHGRFEARDPSNTRRPGDALIRRADELLHESTHMQQRQPPAAQPPAA